MAKFLGMAKCDSFISHTDQHPTAIHTMSSVVALILCMYLATALAFAPALTHARSSRVGAFTLQAKQAKERVPESPNIKSKVKESPAQASVEKKGLEPKYLVALGVFFLAALWDKQYMHGGIFH